MLSRIISAARVLPALVLLPPDTIESSDRRRVSWTSDDGGGASPAALLDLLLSGARCSVLGRLFRPRRDVENSLVVDVGAGREAMLDF